MYITSPVRTIQYSISLARSVSDTYKELRDLICSNVDFLSQPQRTNFADPNCTVLDQAINLSKSIFKSTLFFLPKTIMFYNS